MTAAAPACSAWTLSATVSLVESAPVPATTGTRPAAASTVSSTSSRRSAWLRVVNSPVLPPGTRPPTPAPIRRSTLAASASPSMAEPSAVNGVMRAGRTPWNGFWSGTVTGPCGSRDGSGRLGDVCGALLKLRVDALGGGHAGLCGRLHVAQHGEVVAGQVDVAVRAERALERGLQPVATGMRVDVAVLPAVHARVG